MVNVVQSGGKSQKSEKSAIINNYFGGGGGKDVYKTKLPNLELNYLDLHFVLFCLDNRSLVNFY